MSGRGLAPSTAELLAATEWSATPLGPVVAWPAGLPALVATVLGAPLPMALAAGPAYVLVYNDAYAEILGSKHPEAFGRPAAEVLEENWDLPGHGERVREVMRSGQPFVETDTRLPVRRRGEDGPVEQVRFTRAYTAACDDEGRVVGVLTVISETTGLARALTGVADLAARLATALTVDDVSREALRHGVTALGADQARVLLVEGPGLRIARRAGADELDETLDRLPPVWTRVRGDAALPSVRVATTGRPLWLAPGDTAGYPGLLDEPGGAARLTSIASVPLRSASVQGALSLGYESARAFDDTDRAALLTVGSLVAQAMARAQRFDEQRGHAETLQRSMLPAELPHVPGVSLGARYQPSAPGTSAGGDFYDAFLLDDGRLVLAIGDVVGHGVLAAAIMGQVRAALRVLALRDPDPVTVLAGLDPFVASVGPETFVTALVGVLDPRSGRLRLATAGHLPPLVRRPGPAPDAPVAEYVELEASPPLGVDGARAEREIRLGDGDLLVMVTDGLVEVAGHDLGEGLEALRRLVVEYPDVHDPRRLCGLALSRLGTGDDDIAIVVAATGDTHRRGADLELPAEVTSPAVARAWTARMLGRWGLDEDLVGVAQLAVNELVTNALLHARSGTRTELDLDDRRLLVLVTDSGMASVPEAQAAAEEAMRGRGLALIESLTDAWGSERTSRGTTVWFELARSPHAPAAAAHPHG